MPRASAWPACRTAATGVVVASGIIDVCLVLLPLTLAVALRTAPAARLTEAVVALVLLVGMLTTHCLHGRGVGGWALGLRCVDDVAGLPPASPRALLAVLHAGHYWGATVYDVRNAADPSRGTLRSLSIPAPTATSPAAAPAHATPPTQATAPARHVAPAEAPPPPPPPSLTHAPVATPLSAGTPLSPSTTPAAAPSPAAAPVLPPPSFAPATRRPRRH